MRKPFDLSGLRIPESGLRPESFAYLRAGGKVYGGKPSIGVLHTGDLVVYDGRHRLLLAREAGEQIDVVVRWYGPRGGLLRTQHLRAIV